MKTDFAFRLKIIFIALFLVTLFSGCGPGGSGFMAPDPASLTGTVKDFRSGLPVSGARVDTYRSGVQVGSVLSLTDGTFYQKLNTGGSYEIVASSASHKVWSLTDVQILRGETRTVKIDLVRAKGITITPVSGKTSENGTPVFFEIYSNTAPSADVSLDFTSSNESEITVFPMSVTFTKENWRKNQIIIARGVDDIVDDGEQSVAITFNPSVSTDISYNKIQPAPITILNEDRGETPDIIFTVPHEEINEGGYATTVPVSLNTKPDSEVWLTVNSLDEGEGVAQPANLVFKSENWNMEQEITITGVDDKEVDNSQNFNISINSSSSPDAAYAKLAEKIIPVINLDNDENTRHLIPALISPIQGEAIVSNTNIEFKWGKVEPADGSSLSYHFFLCKDNAFKGCPARQVAKQKALITGDPLALGGGFFAMALCFVASGGVQNRRRGAALLLVLICLLFQSCCPECCDPCKPPPPPPPQKPQYITHEEIQLQPGTTYFWKVVAENQNGQLGQSETRQFTTSDKMPVL